MKEIDILVKSKSKLIGLFVNFTKSKEEAEDIYQDVCLKAIPLLEAGKYKDMGKNSAFQWFVMMGKNIYTDKLRKKMKMPTYEIPSLDAYDDDILDIEKWIPDSLIEYEESNSYTDEEFRLLFEGIRRLPSHLKIITIDNHFKDIPFREISEKMGIGLNTVLGMNRQIKNRLRNHILNNQ